MDRRHFLTAAIGGVAGSQLAALSSPSPKLAKVSKWDGAGWVQVRMFELKVGDKFTIDDGDAMIVMSDPQCIDGVWEVTSETA